MRAAPSTTAGLRLVIALSLAVSVSGCAPSNPNRDSKDNATNPAESSYSPNPDPKQALLDSTTELTRGNFRFTVTTSPSNASESSGKLSTSGSVHARSQSAEAVVVVTTRYMKMSMQYRLIGEDEWYKITLDSLVPIKSMSGMTDQWFQLDRTKLTSRHDILIDFSKSDMLDPTFTPKIIACVSSAQRSDTRNYTGLIDLSQLDQEDPMGLASWADYSPDKAKAVPFRAALDMKGRLENLRIDIPETTRPGYIIELRYSDYGNAPATSRPENSKDATEQIYQSVGLYSW